MHLHKPALLQMNAEWLKKLPAERLREVSIRRLDDVKELQDQLNQNPASQAPSKKPGAGEEENEVDEPHLPFIDNAAEQARQHGSIARYLSHGTRSEAVSRYFRPARAWNSPCCLSSR